MNALRALPKVPPLVSLFLAIFASMAVLIGWQRMEMNAAIDRQSAETDRLRIEMNAAIERQRTESKAETDRLRIEMNAAIERQSADNKAELERLSKELTATFERHRADNMAELDRLRIDTGAALEEAKAERAELRGDIGKLADAVALLAQHLARLEGTVAGALAIAAPRPAEAPGRAR